MYIDKFESLIGTLTVICDDSSLHRIVFGDAGECIRPNYVTDKVISQLQEYFDGKRQEFEIPLSLSGTEFQLTVWNQLLKIPYAKTCTYGELARSIGKRGGARAVGGANNKNPIPIIIPCHRVVAADGIGGYGPGVEIKKVLLEIEMKNGGAV